MTAIRRALGFRPQDTPEDREQERATIEHRLDRQTARIKALDAQIEARGHKRAQR